MHRMCVTYDFKLQFWQKGAAERMNAMDAWLEEHVPKGEYTFEFEDYGQHGEYILHIARMEDFTALKLAIAVE